MALYYLAGSGAREFTSLTDFWLIERTQTLIKIYLPPAKSGSKGLGFRV